MDSFQATIGLKWMTNRENKIIVTFRSNPTRNRKFQKNSKKIQKIKKYHNEIISSKKQVGKGWEKEKIKNYRSVSFLPDA